MSVDSSSGMSKSQREKYERHSVYLNSKETSLKSGKKYKNHWQGEYRHTLKGRKTLLSAVHGTRTWDLSFMK